jgi:hypothetical protein
MPSDEWISPVLNYSNEGYYNSSSSNATTSNGMNASILSYNTTQSAESFGFNNHTSLSSGMNHSHSMSVWSQLTLYIILIMFVCFAFRNPSSDTTFRSGLRQRRQARLAELRNDPSARERAMEQGLITKVRCRSVFSAALLTFVVLHVWRMVLSDFCDFGYFRESFHVPITSLSFWVIWMDPCRTIHTPFTVRIRTRRRVASVWKPFKYPIRSLGVEPMYVDMSFTRIASMNGSRTPNMRIVHHVEHK